MPLLLFVATIAFVGFIALALIVARFNDRDVRGIAAALIIAFLGWCAVYGTLLVSTSLASETRVLGFDESKRFCGFYLDCHLHASVVGIDSGRSLGSGQSAVYARGQFLIVVVRVSSDARREPTHFIGPRAVVHDALGRTFKPSEDAARALGGAGMPFVPITNVVGAGDSFLTTLVFDVPTDARTLVLDLTDGYAIDRFIEMFLIGDDDSLLHAPTVFRLVD